MSDASIATRATGTARPANIGGRGFRLTLARCLGMYAMVFLAALAVLGVMVYMRYQAMALQPYGLDVDVDVERFLAPVLFAAALVWQWFFFTTAICHGVSRRSFVAASAVGGTVLSLAVSAVVVAVRYPLIIAGGDIRMVCSGLFGGCIPSDLFKAPLSEQFLYAWQRVGSPCDGATCDSGGDMSTYYSPMLPAGWLFMFLKLFSLMLVAVALGMAVGAVFAWAAGKGNWVLGVTFGLIVVLYGLRFDIAYRAYAAWPMAFGGWGLPWFIEAVSGRVIDVTQVGVDFGTYIVWIPLALSLFLFAVCALIAWGLTRRREIRPARGRLG